MAQKPYMRRVLAVLETLVWCHDNESRHLLGAAEFSRIFNAAWRDAAALLKEELPVADALRHDPVPDFVTKEALKGLLESAIREEIHGEGALIEKARLMEGDNPNTPLPGGETAETVGAVIWERGDTGDIVSAAKNCGAILAYFYIARHFDIALPPEVKALEEWGDTINPS